MTTSDQGLMEPAEYLLARYAEEERDAREAVTVEAVFRDRDCQISYAWQRVTKNPGGGMGFGVMPGAPSPHFVLADIAAKRAIVKLHPEMLECCQGCAAETFPCRTLLALLQPYADRPDFDARWRS